MIRRWPRAVRLLKDHEAGPRARLEEASEDVADYQVLSDLQEPLPGLSQARAYVPSDFLVMLNFVPSLDFEVTSTL